MKKPEKDIQREGGRCRDSRSCKITDSQREKLAQLETEGIQKEENVGGGKKEEVGKQHGNETEDVQAARKKGWGGGGGENNLLSENRSIQHVLGDWQKWWENYM